jgi:formylglycine-generating enzyme required for sulfatase activity
LAQDAARTKNEIDAEDIAKHASVDDALTLFYRDALAKALCAGITERALRLWFDEKLITSAGTRGMAFHGEKETAGLPNSAVEILRNCYIIRVDSRGINNWYELAHDRLVDPIRKDNLVWKAEYRNPVAEALERNPENLLEGAALIRALQFAKENPEQLTEPERAFLRRSQQAANKARAQRIRINILLLLLAIGFVAWLKQDLLRDKYFWFHEMQAPILPAREKPSGFADCQKGCPELVILPAGKFMMGSQDPPLNFEQILSAPVHQVSLANPIAVSKTEITFAQWDVCVKAGGCQAAEDKWGRGDQPVIDVGWPAAVAYTQWLSRVSGKKYRLLSESEWEYAARAGSTTRYFFGDDEAQLDQNAWSKANSGGQTHPVSQKKPNAFGLEDMAGNAGEWVLDYMHPDYQGAPADGSAWMEGGDRWRRIVRGGSWKDGAAALSSSARVAGTADGRSYTTVSFRIARSL